MTFLWTVAAAHRPVRRELALTWVKGLQAAVAAAAVAVGEVGLERLLLVEETPVPRCALPADGAVEGAASRT